MYNLGNSNFDYFICGEGEEIMLFCAIEGDPSSSCRFFNSLNNKCMKFKKNLRIRKQKLHQGYRYFVVLCRDCEKYKETHI